MKLLNYANLNTHKGRPCTPSEKRLALWHTSDSFLHCCIESQGCRFSKEGGACAMCDYGVGRNLAPTELEEALEKTLCPALMGIKTILFGSYGSVLDEYEMSSECFDIVLDFAKGCSFENIIFETHYSTVTPEKLLKINNALGNRFNITIEMGYESCDEYILSNCLGKVMNLKELTKAMAVIHSAGMNVSLNVFLGAPFISVQEQTLSTVRSVEWAFENGADDVVIFPSNIKPFTFVYDLYKGGYYSEVSHWQLVDVLDRIPDEYLDRVTFSWFGDRKNFYEDDKYPLIPPKDCKNCHEKIFEFYRDFRSINGSAERKQLLDSIVKSSESCLCRKEYLHKFNSGNERLSSQRIEEIIKNVTGQQTGQKDNI